MGDTNSGNILVDTSFIAMGTRISIILVGDGRKAIEARRASDAVMDMMQRFGRDFWAWGDGRLAQLNRALSSGDTIRIPHDMRDIFALAWRVRCATQGRYEPRIGGLVKLWGFHDQNEPGTKPPAPESIAGLLAAISRAPGYDGGGEYGPAPGVVWDFGAIGKGYIVDRCLEYLKMSGFPDAFIDAGGNLAARGMRGERRWCVGIRDPRSQADRPRVLAVLEIENEAVVTHGDDQRYFEYQGERYAHVLDPACGRPVRGLRSLTVVHSEAMRADAEGMALYVEGADGWQERARRLGLDQLLAVRDDGRLLVTRRLAPRLILPDGVNVDVV